MCVTNSMSCWTPTWPRLQRCWWCSKPLSWTTTMRRWTPPTLHKYAPRVAFQVFHEGKLALRSAQAPTAAMTGGDAGFVRGFRSLELQGQRWRVFAARGAEADVQVYVGEAESSRTDILRAVLRSTLWPLLLALPLLAVGVWWAVRRGTAPLRQMGEQLARRARPAPSTPWWWPMRRVKCNPCCWP
jgi:hypothetical protein